jgi:hypothetical protein
MGLTKEQLFDLKDQVSEAKTKASELTGQLQLLEKQFEADWVCKTVEEGKSKLHIIERQIHKVDKSIEHGAEEIKQLLNQEEE